MLLFLYTMWFILKHVQPSREKKTKRIISFFSAQAPSLSTTAEQRVAVQHHDVTALAGQPQTSWPCAATSVHKVPRCRSGNRKFGRVRSTTRPEPPARQLAARRNESPADDTGLCCNGGQHRCPKITCLREDFCNLSQEIPTDWEPTSSHWIHATGGQMSLIFCW